MPNNKQLSEAEGVSDLVTRMQVIAFKLEIPSRLTELYKLSYSLRLSSLSRVPRIAWIELMPFNSVWNEVKETCLV